MKKEINKIKNTNSISIEEKIPKMVEGLFKIQAIDVNTKEVIYEFEEKNKILIWVYDLFSKSVYGYQPPNIDDFRIHAIALGTNGTYDNNIPKEIDINRKRLFSEDNFWEGQWSLDQKAYVYQVTFSKPNTDSDHMVTKLNEGATFPHVNGEPKNYRGTPMNYEDELEAGVTVNRSFENGVLKQSIYMGKLAGNGSPMWTEGPKYSEIALYMTTGATDSGDYLGTIFSMKTFPDLPKSDSCVIKIQYDLNFNIT